MGASPCAWRGQKMLAPFFDSTLPHSQFNKCVRGSFPISGLISPSTSSDAQAAQKELLIPHQQDCRESLCSEHTGEGFYQ